MSEKINIENSLYEFDIILLSPDGEKVIPINKSSVKYLEVEDNLANIGIVGKIILSNYYGLLQKLNIYNVTTESPNIFIRFKNLDFDSAGASVIPQVYVHATLGKSTEMSSNVIDRHVAFEFEESSIVNLKRKKINATSNIFSIGNQKPEATIISIFDVYNKGSIVKTDVAISDLAVPSSVFKYGDSAYDIVSKCYEHLAYKSTVYPDAFTPGLITLENVEGKAVERKLVIKSLAKEMSTFFQIAKNGGDASAYLNDKFTVAFSHKAGVLKDNVIVKYDIMRVDYEEAFEKKWSNLAKISGDTDISNNEFISYAGLREAFEQSFTRPYACNLPQRDTNSIKILTYNYQGAVPEDTTTAWATNKVFKSFIYDNVAIVFKVKGQPYRVPGKFIRINMDEPTMANKDATSSKSCAPTKSDETSADIDTLNGWWYVISVQHVFENDIYTNKITAVKVYLPVALGPPTFQSIGDVTGNPTSGWGWGEGGIMSKLGLTGKEGARAMNNASNDLGIPTDLSPTLSDSELPLQEGESETGIGVLPDITKPPVPVPSPNEGSPAPLPTLTLPKTGETLPPANVVLMNGDGLFPVDQPKSLPTIKLPDSSMPAIRSDVPRSATYRPGSEA